MARKVGNFLKGVLGNLVFRKMHKKQIVSQRVPKGKIKHTKGTIKSANTFGMASSLGSQVIESSQNTVKGLQDYSMTYRLNSELSHVLNECRDKETRVYSFNRDSFSGLAGFDYNVESKLKRSLTNLPVVNLKPGKLGVSILKLISPAKFKFPLNSSKCELTVSVAFFRLFDGLRSGRLISQSLVIFKNDLPFEGHTFEFDIPDGCLCITSLSMEYSISGGERWIVINSKKFSPACICDATISDGIYHGGDKIGWSEMVSFA